MRIVRQDLKSTKDPYSSMIIPATGQRTNRRNRPMKKGTDPCRTVITLSLQSIVMVQITEVSQKSNSILAKTNQEGNHDTKTLGFARWKLLPQTMHSAVVIPCMSWTCAGLTLATYFFCSDAILKTTRLVIAMEGTKPQLGNFHH